MFKQKLINLKQKLSLIWEDIPQRNRKLIVIAGIFLSLTLIATIFLTRQSKQTITYKPKASDQNQPDPRCSLEVEVEDVQTEPSPILTTTLTPTQTTTPKPTTTKTPTATPILCPVVVSGNCPESLPLPENNAYPKIIMTSAVIGSDTYDLPKTETLIAQESQTIKVSYSAQRVSYRKICRIACTDANDKATCDYGNGWTNCMNSNEGSSFNYPLPKYLEGGKNDYHILIAGYSADDNYSCSNQLWYTAGEHNQAIVACGLGTVCCQNQVIKVRVNQTLD